MTLALNHTVNSLTKLRYLLAFLGIAMYSRIVLPCTNFLVSPRKGVA